MTWDLAEVIAERSQPSAEVVVYLNEVASHAKVQLLHALKSETDPEKVQELENRLEEVEEALESKKYTITLAALPTKFRKAINAEARAKYPLKRGPLGLSNDDPTQERIDFENNLLFAAMIRDVVNPVGDSKKDWTKDEAFKFIEAIPAAAQSLVDATIRRLHEESEQFTSEVMDPNL